MFSLVGFYIARQGFIFAANINSLLFIRSKPALFSLLPSLADRRKPFFGLSNVVN